MDLLTSFVLNKLPVGETARVQVIGAKVIDLSESYGTSLVYE
jgi:hypothetical protein